MILDLIGTHHMTYRHLQGFLKDHLGVVLSLGCLFKILIQAMWRLRPVYRELRAAVKTQPRVGADETGWRHRSRRLYVWIFEGAKAVACVIGTRASEMLKKVLGGDWVGILNCDCCCVYTYFASDKDIILQLCLAHLKRDFERCAQYDLSRADFRRYGERGVALVQELIHAFNLHRDLIASGKSADSKEAAALWARLERLREELTAHALNAPMECRKARNIAARFRKRGKCRFTFLDRPGIPSANNGAETGLRGGPVISRKIGLSTQSMAGKFLRETLWTIIATLKLQGRNPLEYFAEALKAAIEGKPVPSILNPGQPVAGEYVEMAAADKEIAKTADAFDARERDGAEKPAEGDPEKPSSLKKLLKGGQEKGRGGTRRSRKGGTGGPRPEGGTDGPRPEGGTERPRPEGETDGPHPEGGPERPRPESGTDGPRPEAPKPEGRPKDWRPGVPLPKKGPTESRPGAPPTGQGPAKWRPAVPPTGRGPTESRTGDAPTGRGPADWRPVAPSRWDGATGRPGRTPC
jgi:hypothetical protein